MAIIRPKKIGDKLFGTRLADWIFGSAGNDVINGGLGIDVMRGRAGNDIYHVDRRTDKVIELPGQGIDLVRSTTHFALGANVERLALLGTTNINGIGNALDNTIIGNAGNNLLSGGAGNDYLLGGAGGDILIGGIGNDTLRGDAGADTARFSGKLADYDFQLVPGGVRVIHARGTKADGTDLVLSVERLQFADQSFLLSAGLPPAPNSAPTAVVLSNTVTATPENGAAAKVADIAVTDDGIGSNTLSLSGADAASFSIVNGPSGKELWFNGPANFEVKSTYDVTVQVDDASVGATPDASASFTLTVTDANDVAPLITSGTTGAEAENTATSNIVYQTAVTDPDTVGTITYLLTGDDAGLFTVDASGAVRFIASPDFEAPADLNGDNAYEIIVNADDGVNPVATQAVTITVTDANDVGLVITSGTTGAEAENTATSNIVYQTAVTDPDTVGTTTYSLTGDDAGLFTIDASGAVRFIASPDFEAPADLNGDNAYEIIVNADDGVNPIATQAVTITVTDANDVAPLITSGTTGAEAENTATSNIVYQTAVTDPDTVGTITYSLTGDDAGLFTIDASGAVRFIASPDFEAPADLNGDNAYEIIVNADDGVNPIATQAVTITVTDANDVAPLITSGTTGAEAENTATSNIVYQTAVTDPDTVGTITYSLTGDDAGLFTIDASGAVRFIASPDFEAPADLNGDNAYEIIVNADDGVNPIATQAVTITVTDANDVAPLITSGTTGAEAENTATSNIVYQTAVTDPDTVGTITYSLTGDDAGLFTIDASGAVRFIASPDFEAPADLNGDNAYEIIVNADDGVNPVATQAVTITVTDANDVAPLITSGTTGAEAENTATSNIVYQTAVTDPDTVGTITYSLTGDDAGLFTIDASGAVRFIASPDFEAPADLNGDNAYEIIVNADDGVNPIATQAVTITVTDANDAPTAVVLSNTVTSTPENGAAVKVADITITDDGVGTNEFSLSGTDPTAFSIMDGLSGKELWFNGGANFEVKPTYDVTVVVDDTTVGASPDASAIFTLTISDANDPPNGTDKTIAVQEEAVYTFSSLDFGFTDEDPPSGFEPYFNFAVINIDTLPAIGQLYFDGGPLTSPVLMGASDPDLGRLTYVAPADLAEGIAVTFQFRVGDTGGAVDPIANTITINLTPVNDAPVNSVPGAQTTNQNTPKVFNTANSNLISVADFDTATLTVTLTAADGTITLSPSAGLGSVTGEGTSIVTLSGSQAAINTALDGLSFAPTTGFSGPASIQIATFDGTTIDTNSVAITVVVPNAPPTDIGFTVNASAGTSTNQTSLAAASTIGTFLGVDSDTPSLTYSLSGGNSGSFSVNASTGVLSVGASALSNNAYSFNVDVFDGTTTYSEAMTIAVGGNGNDNLTNAATSNLVIFGLNGNDTLMGSTGADILVGGDDDDTVVVTSGGDIMTGGTGGSDTISFANAATAVTFNLATTSLQDTGISLGNVTQNGFENISGGGQGDTLTGDANANIISGAGGADIINGGAGADMLIGGGGADTINTGAADDNLQDQIQFGETSEYGDTVNNFDSTGSSGQVDRVLFGGTLNSNFDDANFIVGGDDFTWGQGDGDGIADNSNADIGGNLGDFEGLLLTGANGEGVANALLTNTTAVANAFNAEFNILAATGDDAVLVINDTDGNSFSVWQYIQASGGTSDIDISELSLIGVVNANANVGANSFDFV